MMKSIVMRKAANRHRSKSTGPFHTDERLRSAPVSRANRTRPCARIPFGNRENVICNFRFWSSAYTRTRSITCARELACQSEVEGLPLRRGRREAVSTSPPKAQGPRASRSHLTCPCLPTRLGTSRLRDNAGTKVVVAYYRKAR